MTPELVSDSREELLDSWLETAVRGLCGVARARIIGEITEHVLNATDDGMLNGLQTQQARTAAVKGLGDPNRARSIFIREHLTQREARIVSRLNLLTPPAIVQHVGIQFVLFGLASWLFAILCLAEYTTLTGGAGRLSTREAILIAPWTLWLGYFVLGHLCGGNGATASTGRALRRRIHWFYALMGASGLALLAATDGYLLAIGVIWLLLILTFSLSRLSLAVKLGRVNQKEVEAFFRAPGCDARLEREQTD